MYREYMNERLIRPFMRGEQKNQIPVVFALTGVNQSEKKLIANLLDNYFFELGHHCCLFTDEELNPELSIEERLERSVWTVKKLLDTGIIVIALFNSEEVKDREFIKASLKNDNYLEVFFSEFINESLEGPIPDEQINTSDKSIDVNFKKILSLVSKVDLRP
jgi:adenylylsulfate kinase-like enzyme